MKRFSSGLLFGLLALVGCAQKTDKAYNNSNTLLWKISGNGIEKPSYLFGTIHMLCAEDAILSVNMKKAIRNADEIYFEVDLDDMMEMLSVFTKMKMNGDTTFRDLLSKEDYELVKNYFENKGSMIPFSMLETFKPMLAASTLEQGDLPCKDVAMMEQVIQQEANTNKKEIRGLESMSYQAGILDSIPYQLQAQELVDFIKGNGKTEEGQTIEDLMKAYKEQNLSKLDTLMLQSDAGMANFTDVLLYNRNRNWVKKLKDILPKKGVVIAVGAGHLPGDKGVINLLRKEGFTVEPVENKMLVTKEI